VAEQLVPEQPVPGRGHTSEPGAPQKDARPLKKCDNRNHVMLCNNY